MDWVDKPQNYKDLYRILQLLRGSHLNNFRLETLKLGWVAFHSVKFQLKCLDFQSNQYTKLVPVLSRFCNWLYYCSAPERYYDSYNHKHSYTVLIAKKFVTNTQLEHFSQKVVKKHIFEIHFLFCDSDFFNQCKNLKSAY